MGSLQQITMGVVCLFAAFWFGSHLQNQPAGQNQTVALLPDGTIDPAQAAQPGLLEKTKGILSSLFDSPTKPKPITVDDLRQRSRTARPDLPVNAFTPKAPNNGLQRPGVQTPAAQPLLPPKRRGEDLFVSADTVQTPDVQRLVGAFVTDQSPQENLAQVPMVRTPIVQKVAIVPDFSTLAEEVNRGLSFNDAPIARPAVGREALELIPVPRFSDVEVAMPNRTSNTDWESVRQKVAAAERRLTSHREQMMQPIPEIADSVTRQSNQFWDRQQSEARRQQRQPLVVSNQRSAQQQRLKPESWAEKQDRWDVFPADNASGRNRTAEAPRQPISPATTNRFDDRRSTENGFTPRRAPANATTPNIVEVDRGYVASNVPARQEASSRVRSLNDEREIVAPQQGSQDQWQYGRRNGPQYDRSNGPQYDRQSEPRNERVAMQRPQGGQQSGYAPELRNQLRPQFDRNAGSSPEFVSPPDHAQFQNRSQNSSPSEIVEAASVAYGSFKEYQTRDGDTLQTISQEFYGSPDYYFDLYLANRALLSNPATVPTGVTLKIPRFDAN